MPVSKKKIMYLQNLHNNTFFFKGIILIIHFGIRFITHILRTKMIPQ